MSASVRPLKKFGQNFLTNQHIAEKIVDSLKIKTDDLIVEIGPGKGVLTKILSGKDLNQVIAIEVDSRLINDLNLLNDENSKIKIIQKDFMEIDLEEFIIPGTNLKIIGNIPYHLTSSILFKLFENFQSISRVVLMIQKEVANRIVSNPRNKEYGILSVLTGLHGMVKKEFEVKRTDFYPIPKVDSAVVSIDFYSALDGLYEYDLFLYLVKGCFQTRRKMLQNSLKRIFGEDITKSIGTTDLQKRPEELSVQEFISLSNEIFDLKKAKL
jgi:16S rRNA (adenine1518-N6/adenine1519-N6)-dimethyltransferase